MPQLIACSSCGQHVLEASCACVHCGVKLRDCGLRYALAATAAAALMGLSVPGCEIIAPQPKYGVPDTADTADTADTDVQTDDTNADDTGPIGTDYGVADTGDHTATAIASPTATATTTTWRSTPAPARSRTTASTPTVTAATTPSPRGPPCPP